MPTALVVGAGLSGLSAAYRLKQSGWDAKVVEASHKAGGRAQTVHKDGYVFDIGPDGISSAYVSYLALLEEVGLGHLLEPSNPVAGIIRNGRVIDIDNSKIWSGITTRALSLHAKLNFAIGQFRLRKQTRSVDGFEMARAGDLDDRYDNALRFAERYFGKEVADHIIGPLCRISTGTSVNVSRLHVLGALSVWSAPLVSVRGGMDILPLALAANLDVELGRSIESVRKHGSEVVYTYQGDPAEHRADAAIIATQFDTACQIAPSIAAISDGLDKRIKPCRLLLATLGYRKATKSKAYFVTMPTVEDEDVLMLTLQHNKCSDRAPPGHSLVTVYIEDSGFDKFNAMSDEEVTAFSDDLISKLYPELKEHLDTSLISRWPRALWVAQAGYYKDVKRLWEKMKPDDPIQLAGDIFSSASMENAVRFGAIAAKRLIENRA